MTLAARCPSCRTAFRVVRDQLRVGEGWVRCGRCAAVFDATQTLFEVDGPPAAPLPLPPPPQAGAALQPAPAADVTLTRPAAPQATSAVAAAEATAQADLASPPPVPPAWSEPMPPAAMSVDELHAALFGPQPAPAPEEAEATAADPPDGPPAWHDDAPGPGHADAPDPGGPVPPPGLEPPAATAADGAAPGPAAEPALAPTRDDGAADPGRATEDADAAAAAAPPPVTVDPPADAPPVVVPAAPPAPTFVRVAERAARWRSTPVRLALASAALLLAGAALLQGARAFHDPIAVHWPAARPLLDALCPLAGCTTGPRRLIEGLRVESSALVHLDDGGRQVRLTLTLRNRHPLPLAPPAVELTLTDARGDIVSRRVLRPAELGVRSDRIAPGAELPMRAVIDTGELRVVGYTLEVFYP
jgi:predicted Zn finger-like uncharacterized protein